MPFVTDSMTGSAGTTLQSHTGEVGATWTLHTGLSVGTQAVLSDVNRVRHDLTGETDYYASGVPAAAEYDVSADFVVKSLAGEAGLYGRMAVNPTADGYLFYYNNGAGQWILEKVVGGTYTSLGTFTQTLTDEQTYAIKLAIRDATKKGYVATVERISSADNAITAANRAGLLLRVGSNTTGFHLDGFDASDLATGLPPGLGPVTHMKTPQLVDAAMMR